MLQLPPDPSSAREPLTRSGLRLRGGPFWARQGGQIEWESDRFRRSRRANRRGATRCSEVQTWRTIGCHADRMVRSLVGLQPRQVSCCESSRLPPGIQHAPKQAWLAKKINHEYQKHGWLGHLGCNVRSVLWADFCSGTLRAQLAVATGVCITQRRVTSIRAVTQSISGRNAARAAVLGRAQRHLQFLEAAPSHPVMRPAAAAKSPVCRSSTPEPPFVSF